MSKFNGVVLGSMFTLFPGCWWYFVRPGPKSLFYTLFMPVALTSFMIAFTVTLIDLLLTKFKGPKIVSFYLERTYPIRLQSKIMATLKNPYKWADNHPWKLNGWKPFCCEINRHVITKHDRNPNMLDKITNLEELFSTGPQLCLWKDGNCYCVRNLDKISDKRDILEFSVVKRGVGYPFETERIVYQIGYFRENGEDVIKLGCANVATIKSRLHYLIKRPRHMEFERDMMDYIYTLDNDNETRYAY